jgi:fructosamine-3-kinase
MGSVCNTGSGRDEAVEESVGFEPFVELCFKKSMSMVPASIRNYLNRSLPQKLGLRPSSLEISPIGGGSINETYRVTINGKIKFFLKLNSASKYPLLFEKEKHGLELLTRHNIIQVPSVVACEGFDKYQILLLEWIEGGTRDESFWTSFGEQLARLHQRAWLNKDGQTLFGLDQDNYMGSLPQQNSQRENWVDFFTYNRLQPQINLARGKLLLHTKHLNGFENLVSRLEGIFDNEQSALLHGDLWSGNFMCNENSQAVLIDPAIYFGHRSMDLAMTTFPIFQKLSRAVGRLQSLSVVDSSQSFWAGIPGTN